MSKTVRSLYIFTLLKHCSRLYKSAICLCLKVSCRSKYCSKISSRRHHKAQRALFVFEYGRDACASRWAERRRTVNYPSTLWLLFPSLLRLVSPTLWLLFPSLLRLVSPTLWLLFPSFLRLVTPILWLLFPSLLRLVSPTILVVIPFLITSYITYPLVVIPFLIASCITSPLVVIPFLITSCIIYPLVVIPFLITSCITYPLVVIPFLITSCITSPLAVIPFLITSCITFLIKQILPSLLELSLWATCPRNTFRQILRTANSKRTDTWTKLFICTLSERFCSKFKYSFHLVSVCLGRLLFQQTASLA